MTEYDNSNRGVLFKNDRKTKDTHPDYQGSIDVDGDEFWLSAWIKESRNGSKFMSLSIKPKEEQQEAAPPAAPRRSAPPPPRQSGGGGGRFDDMDDDIPFAPMATGRAFLSLT